MKISTSPQYCLGSSFKMLGICLSYQLYGINKCGEVWVGLVLLNNRRA